MDILWILGPGKHCQYLANGWEYCKILKTSVLDAILSVLQGMIIGFKLEKIFLVQIERCF